MSKKPTAKIRPHLVISSNPSKNYLMNLLADDIAASGARRAFDAGCGRLRNFWMFDGAYVGISINAEGVLLGLKEPMNVDLVAKRGMPDIYLMRLERDFSFLGNFDLCVCTETIFYTENPVDVVTRMSDVTRPGGTLLLSDHLEGAHLQEYVTLLKSRFADVSVTYWGYGELNRYNKAWSYEDVLKLTLEEMGRENVPDNHTSFYIKATNRLPHAVTQSPEPETLDLKGLHVVKLDIPWLQNIHLLGEVSQASATAEEILNARKMTAAFGFQVDGKLKKRMHVSWYRGENCNFNPTKENFLDPDTIEESILKGYLPKAPFISKTEKITAFGSCFAQHISNYLVANGYTVLTKGNSNAYIISCGEGMVNTYALLQQFEWAFERKQFSQNLWHGYDTEEHIYDETVRQNTLEIFRNTDVFIITVGLSEVWHDRNTGEVFWRAIPIDKFDPKRHGFRITTHEENRANLERIHQIIRAHRPNAHVVFTLSPIPLVATFRPLGCVSANTVSKAILRSALDEVMRAHPEDANLHYFPSYELVTTVFRDSFVADRHHVRKDILDFVMSAFERYFCTGDADANALRYYAALAAALTADEQVAAAERAQSKTTALSKPLGRVQTA